MNENNLEFEKVRILPDGRLNAKNAAVYLGLSAKTLAKWRCDGMGPRFIKKGEIFYYKHDIDEWIASAEKVVSTAQAKAMQCRPEV